MGIRTRRGRAHLAYELHITNLGSRPLSVERIEVLGDGRTLATNLTRVNEAEPEQA